MAQYEFGIGRGVVEVKAGVRARSDGGDDELELDAAAAVKANARVVAADCILCSIERLLQGGCTGKGADRKVVMDARG